MMAFPLHGPAGVDQLPEEPLGLPDDVTPPDEGKTPAAGQPKSMSDARPAGRRRGGGRASGAERGTSQRGTTERGTTERGATAPPGTTAPPADGPVEDGDGAVV